MRRTPLFLAVALAGGILLALSGTVWASGDHASGTNHTSTHAQSGHQSNHSSGPATSSGRSNTNASGGSGERDVPGSSVDPSSKAAHDRDNGIGNDCDPGFGGSPNDTGNDGRSSAASPGATSPTSEAENGGTRTSCHTSGGHGGTPPGNGCTSNCTPPGCVGCGGGGEQQQHFPPSCMGNCGHGGGNEVSNVQGLSTRAATGVGGAASAAAGVGLANTGFRTVGLGILALLLIVVGFALMIRRPRKARI